MKITTPTAEPKPTRIRATAIFANHDDEHGGKRVFGVSKQMGWRQAQRRCNPRNEAIVSIEYVPPDQTGGDIGEDVRQEKDHAECDGAKAAIGKEHGNRE